MSEQDLCVKCHEYYCDKYGVGAFFRPDQHCHHPEPKWEEKKKCWCETDNMDVWKYRKWNYCPKCGKKLGKEE